MMEKVHSSPKEQKVDELQEVLGDLEIDVRNAARDSLDDLKQAQHVVTEGGSSVKDFVTPTLEACRKKLMINEIITKAEVVISMANNDLSKVKVMKKADALHTLESIRQQLENARTDLFESEGGYNTINGLLSSLVEDENVSKDTVASPAVRLAAQNISDRVTDLRASWNVAEGKIAYHIGKLIDHL